MVAAVATALALLVGYVQRAAVSSDQFANRAAAALRDDSVRTLIAERVTDQVILAHQSDLIAARPVIESAVASAVGGRAFGGVFRSGVRDVHRAVFDRDEHTLTFALRDVGTIVAAGLEVVEPSLADRVRATAQVDLVNRDIGSATATAARAARTVKIAAWLLLLVALGAAAGALALARDKRVTVTRLGASVAVSGVVLVVALGVVRAIALGHVHGLDERAAAGAIWDAFLGDLSTAAWVLAACGAVVAAAAASLIRPVPLDAPLRRAAAALTAEPLGPVGRVLRGAGLVGVGLLCLLARDTVLHVLFAVTGVYLVYAGVSAILWVVYKPRAEHEAPHGARHAAHADRRRAVAVSALAAVLVAFAIGAFVATGGTSTAAPAAVTCNGSAALCDRPFDEVALPATHNSMSVPLPGWYSAEQDASIAAQLHAGVRGLLIDTHYADKLADGRLRTDVGDPAQLKREAREDGVSESAVDAALRTRERLGFAGSGTRGMYLCHSLCELGGTPLEDVLTDLHDFLVADPGAVVVVINQDYVTPRDYVDAVRRAGLEPFAYRGPVAAGRWPTLRQMIDSGQRVVFLAENHAGAAPWYRLAYETITQETPYAFKHAEDLTDPARLKASCAPNRGPSSAALFLVNHWVTTDPVPLPSNADKVNAYGPLMRRLRECERIRHHIPNLVAVNFYRHGDLFKAVDTLNRVAGR
ncbi:MAG TPA: hypothetical protein VNS09_13555 [Solirubrobacter sp.]|nr:hypothetical protein [Solirubrobacter sp.]